jgi:hypothetical protein
VVAFPLLLASSRVESNSGATRWFHNDSTTWHKKAKIEQKEQKTTPSAIICWLLLVADDSHDSRVGASNHARLFRPDLLYSSSLLSLERSK